MLAFDAFGDDWAPRVVLLHGWPLCRDIWSEVAARVAAEGARVLTPDLPGFGGSPPIDPERSNVEAYADDVAAFLRAFGEDRVSVAGHSYGGYVALALAERHPGLLSGLGLIASRTIADSEAARKGRQDTIDKVRAQGTAALLPGLAEKLIGPHADDGLRRRAAEIIARARPDGTIAGLAAMAARPDRSRVLEAFPGPVLVLHGSADALIPVGEVAEPSRTSGELTVRILPSVGHMPMWEAPDATADAIVGWARASSPRR